MFDAVVVGAGPAGSTAAICLAEAGWRVALIEKADFPRRKVCGEFISAPTMTLLESLGVANDFAAQAGPLVHDVALYAGTTIITAPLPPSSQNHGGGRALGREHLDTLLRDRAVAAGAALYQPSELIALERSPFGFRCRLQDQTLETPIVVAATGSWGVKPPFGLDAPPKPSDLLAFKAHFRGSRLPPGLMPLLAFPGGYGGMVATDDGRVSLSCCIRRDRLASLRADHAGRAGETVLAHIQATTEGARAALSSARLEDAILAAGPIRPGIRAGYDGGIFFTGNLAGEAHPVIAEGISMAIQASSLLADHLIAHTGTEAAGKAYARAWRRRFGPRLAASATIAHLAMTAPGRAVMKGAVAILPDLLTLGARLAGKA